MWAGDKLVFMSTGKKHEVLEVGIFHPEETSTGQLYEGQVGYVVCNLKDFEEGEPNLRVPLGQNDIDSDNGLTDIVPTMCLIRYKLAHVGDTVTHPNTKIEPLPGFKPLQSMVFAGVFPLDATDFQKLEEAIGRVRPIRVTSRSVEMILTCAFCYV